MSIKNIDQLLDLGKFIIPPNYNLIDTLYKINNVPVRFLNYSGRIQQEIQHLFRHYLYLKKDEQKQDEIRIHILPPLSREEILKLSSENEVIHFSYLYPDVPFAVYKQGEVIYFIVMNVRCAILNLKKNVAVCYTPENLDGKRFNSIINTLIFPIINEFFALRGRYFLHCASIANNDKGILIAASSGGGKTTLSLCAIRAGYKLLNDDLTILDVNGAHPLFISFTKEMRICSETALMFPELSHLAEQSLVDGKISIWPDDIFHDCTVGSAQASIILFPLDDIGVNDTDYIPVSIDEAMELLIPNGLFITGKYKFHNRLFSFLELLKNIRAYKIRARLDINKIPPLFEKIVNG